MIQIFSFISSEMCLCAQRGNAMIYQQFTTTIIAPMQCKWIKNKIKMKTTTKTTAAAIKPCEAFRTDQSNLELILFLKPFCHPFTIRDQNRLHFFLVFVSSLRLFNGIEIVFVSERVRAEIDRFNSFTPMDSIGKSEKESMCVCACVCDLKCERETAL